MCDLDWQQFFLTNRNRNNQHRAPARTDNRQSGSGFFFFFFSFETRRLRGDRSFRPEPPRIPPLEDIEFLDDIQIKYKICGLNSSQMTKQFLDIVILTSTSLTWSMEMYFPRRCLLWKLFRRIRNQITAHAQKSVEQKSVVSITHILIRCVITLR